MDEAAPEGNIKMMMMTTSTFYIVVALFVQISYVLANQSPIR
jgi:hypothetical protein